MKNMISSIANRYTKQGLWSLFLMCVFPLHIWTLILAFRDMSWVIERTNVWDAIGVVSYGMIFAFVESLVVFVVVVLLGIVTPIEWESDKRIAFLCLLIIIMAIWGMIGQLLFLWNVSLPPSVMQFVARSAHPLRVLYAISLAIVVPTVLLPVYSFVRSKRAVLFMKNLMERLSILSLFYLFFDVIGLIVIIIRNI